MMFLTKVIRSTNRSTCHICNAKLFSRFYFYRNLHTPLFQRNFFQVYRNPTCSYSYSYSTLYSSPQNGTAIKKVLNGYFGQERCHLATSYYCYVANYSSRPKEDNGEPNNKNTRENVWTLPNILTTSRMIVTPFLGYLVVEQYYPLAFGVFVVAGITDVLDGYIARKWDQKTALGSALDPLADKLLVSVLTVTLTMSQLLPVPLAVIILGRDILLILASLYIRYISLPLPRTFSSFCDVSNATVKLHPSNISKLNTFLQISLIASSLAAPVFGFVDHSALQALWFLTGTTTVLSGVGYYVNRNQSVELLQKKRKL